MDCLSSKQVVVESACGRKYEATLFSDGTYNVRQFVTVKGQVVKRSIKSYTISPDGLRQIVQLRDQFVKDSR